MDPNACLRNILDLLGEIYDNESDEGATLDRDRREEASQALQDLAEWLDKGGFAPRAGYETSMPVTSAR